MAVTDCTLFPIYFLYGEYSMDIYNDYRNDYFNSLAIAFQLISNQTDS